ncbi:hypothetical protein [Massilia sp. Se16.2.3]|uniref:hypothetical protein n=1 Tax=Massilia sp. Se16.2.3 TaxID=2709303 RepID=UPI0016037218|nr:hypothetical protein [Massilia sp. Se16.2.3]QNB00192.1 hypothetical protein G4G31_17515 [Massilia sp. Se16.2.3]
MARRTVVYDSALADFAGELMTFNKHVRGVVGTELGAIQQRGFTGALDARPAPRLLYLLPTAPSFTRPSRTAPARAGQPFCRRGRP